MPVALLALALLAFDPGAAARALAQPDARTGALRQLNRLGRIDLDAARAAGLGAVAATVAVDAKVPFTDRVLAIRAAAVLGGGAVPPVLAPLTTPGADAEPEAVALAREAARALRQLGAADALEPALAAHDPEVRAHAAWAGAGGEALCRLLAEDPWSDVRAGAAHGLARHPDAAACIAPALADADPKVQQAAVATAIEAPDPRLREPLRKLAGDAKAPVTARADAFVALGHIGDIEPAEKALALHLDKGGIVPLAEAAVRAMAAAGVEPARLRPALASEAPVVQLAAARALVAAGDRESLDALRALRERVDPRRRAVVDGLIERLGAPSTLGETVDDPDVIRGPTL